MPRTADIQTNFTAGEVSNKLYGRPDLEKYKNAAETLENALVFPHGAAHRRSGSKFIKEVKTSADATRLLPFEFSTTQAYVIEAGDLYFRFYKDQGSILESTTTISGATQANPVVITDTGHGYSDGDEVFIADVVGMTELNGKYYLVANKNANDFELTDIDGTNIDGTGFTAYSSAGTAAKVHQLTTTYAKADLSSIKHAQSADILYLAHQSYAPRKLERTGHTSWTLTTIDFTDGPYQDENTTTTTMTPGATTGSGVTVTASAVTGINGGDGFQTTDVGRLIRIGHQATAWAATTAYSVDDVVRNSGNVYKCIHAGTSDGSGGPSGTGDEIVDATVTWKFILDGGIQWGYGTIASRSSTTVVTVNIVNDLGGTGAVTKWRLGSWSDTTGYPATVAFYEQRLFWAGSTEEPQTLWGSKSADYENHTPGVLADASLIYTIASDQVNVIRFLQPGKVMVVGTAGGEFIVSASNRNEALTPTNVRVVREGTRGSNSTSTALRIDNVVLFIQRQKRKLREFVYTFDSDSYQAPDLTLLSEQVGYGGIEEIAYGQEPDSIVWGYRNDGQLLGMTYLRDQQVVAWHRHPMGGSFGTTTHGVVTSVAIIPGTARHEVWLITKRTVNSVARQYVELLQANFNADDGDTKEDDAFFVDSGLTLDTPLTITGATAANPVVVTSAAHGLTDGDLVDIEDVAGMTEINDIRFRVIESATNTFELMNTSGKPVSAATRANPGSIECVAHGFSTGDEIGFLEVAGMTELNGNAYTITKVDADNFTIGVDSSAFTTYTSGGIAYLLIDGTAYTAYTSGGEAREAITAISGLDHLEGETVSILGDGAVQSDQAVSSGSISSLDPAVSKAKVGLGYTTTIKSLRSNVGAGAGQGTAMGKPKRVFEIIVRLINSLGMKVGPDAANLDEVKFRDGSDPMDSSPPLFNGDKIVKFRGGWDREGQVMIVQDQPLPLTVSALITRVIESDG